MTASDVALLLMFASLSPTLRRLACIVGLALVLVVMGLADLVARSVRASRTTNGLLD